MFLKPRNRIVDFIFDNGKIVALLFIFLVVFGAFSLSQMQRQGFPDVDVNIASVQVVYPSANASQIEDQVLKPIEGVLENLEDVTEYQSTALDSFGSVFVTFDQKADLNTAFTELKNEIATIDFPENVQEPNIQKFSAGGTGDFIVAVSGYTDLNTLFEAGKSLKEDLEGVEGVNTVTGTNPLTPEVIVTFYDDELEAFGVARSQVESVISSAQLSLPVGSYIEREEEVGVILQKDTPSLAAFRSLLVADGVQLDDVADIDFRLNGGDTYNRIGFRSNDDIESDLRIERALLYAVDINADADIIKVAEKIDLLTAELSEAVGSSSGRGPAFATVYSQADSTEDQISEITNSIFGSNFDSLGPFGFIGYLFGGLSLVVILLLIFMNLRVAIMAALAIPLSLFFSSIYLNLAGVDLNTLVLFSMVLTIGLVVDPTIVFLESMQRYKSQGFSGREAAAKTMQTVGLGVFLAVATNILVFVPFGVVSGFFGEIIGYIPQTIIPAMLASFVVPVLFFMPLASVLLKSKRFDWNVADMELAGTWRIARKVGAIIQWLLGPGKAKIALRIVVFVVGISLPVIVGGALISTGAVEVVQFSEQDDADFIVISGDVSQQWTFDRAIDDVIVPLQEELREYPEIKNFSYFEQSGNSFVMLLTLFPIADRADADMRTSNELSEAINIGIEERNLNADIEASTSGEGPPQDEFPVRVRILDNDIEALLAAANDVTEYLSEVEGIDRVEDNISEKTSGGSATLVLDNENTLNLSPFFLFSVLNERLAKNDLGALTFGDQTYELVTELRPAIRSDRSVARIEITTPEDIAYAQQLAVLEAQGNQEAIDALTKPDITFVNDLIIGQTQQESQTIRRVNGERFVEVFASVSENGDALQIQADLEEYLNADKVEELGLKENAVDFQGEADSISQSFTDLFIALGIAIFLIYILLVGFLRSYFEPFIILFAIPLGLVGVLGAVAATTGQLGFLELLGVVAMAGIVVNVTILLIDYANQLKREGKSPAEAISTSVAVRFRPIILTQLTAFGSLIPLVYLSPFWKGLAAAIIFGIISSALLSLFITPILYQWANTLNRHGGRIGEFFSKWRRAYNEMD